MAAWEVLAAAFPSTLPGVMEPFDLQYGEAAVGKVQNNQNTIFLKGSYEFPASVDI